MNFSPDTDQELTSADINVTPLLDVTFCLIMFFMVTTTFMQTQSMNISLPSASTSQETTISREMVVNINAQGDLSVDGETLSLESLRTRIKSWKEKTPSAPTLIIWGDKSAQHGTIVEIMDLAKTEGIDEIAIATTPSATK